MPKLHFETVVEEIEYSSQLMQRMAHMVQNIQREGRRPATASELGTCRELRRALGQNFTQIMTLMRLMQREMKQKPDQGANIAPESS